MVIRRCTLIMNARVFVQKCSGLRLVVRAWKRDREPKHNAPKVGTREGERGKEIELEGKTVYTCTLRLRYAYTTRNTFMDALCDGTDSRIEISK